MPIYTNTVKITWVKIILIYYGFLYDDITSKGLDIKVPIQAIYSKSRKN